jgi:hypothetical protein
MSDATSAMPARPVVPDWRHGCIGPLACCALCENPALNRSPIQDLPGRKPCAEARITSRLAERPSDVNRPLTPKRRRRVVENDEYAAFLRRVINAYSRRVASGDIEAITGMAALAGHLEDATRHAITGLRQFGYSWADIAARLGITRQGAQQRWAEDTPAIVTTPDGARTNGSRP